MAKRLILFKIFTVFDQVVTSVDEDTKYSYEFNANDAEWDILSKNQKKRCNYEI